MKKEILCGIFLIMLFTGGAFSAKAQDLIILKNGNVIETEILEISPTEVRYKRFDHLDRPTIVIMAEDVLSIRYENGRVDIINSTNQPTIAQTVNQLNRNPRLNTLGLTFGYFGVSNFGFSLSSTVSPAKYTFFDFNMGLGFMRFSFNGNINFNGFVPFNKGGWYIGFGLGGGLYEIINSMNGYFAVNAITGFLFFNWLNISATLHMEVIPEFVLRIKPMVGYNYRFKPRQNDITNTENEHEIKQKPEKIKQQTSKNKTSESWVCYECNTINNESRIQCSNCRRTRK